MGNDKTLSQLNHLSLINKICQELDNHLGFSDKDLAELLLEVASSCQDLKLFVQKVKQLDDNFPTTLSESVYRVVRVMKQETSSEKLKKNEAADPETKEVTATSAEGLDDAIRNRLKQNFPGLAIADVEKPKIEPELVEDEKKSRRKDHFQSYKTRRKRNLPDAPEMDDIYDGTITALKDYGCFVSLDDFNRGRRDRSEHRRSQGVEGLVHVSQMQAPGKGRVHHPKEVVSRGMRVKVKVITISGGKISLSLKDVDQTTGRDLEPRDRSRQDSAPYRYRPEIEDVSVDVDHSEKPSAPRRLTSPERWEAQQLINSGVLPVSAYPTFMEDHGILGDTETEEDFEVEVSEAEPPFLKGQTSLSAELDPIKIIKNPDGTLQKAAEAQSELRRERRDIKRSKEKELLDTIQPHELNKAWLDPLAERGERHLASELRGVTNSARPAWSSEPEWKKQSESSQVSYGFVTSKSMTEQREGLPIFTLKQDLLKAFEENQLLVVIGETGSGKTTQMTQYLAELGYCDKGMIGCTQPRRVAAISVAKRVAEECGCRVGEFVGYTIRFEDCTSLQTRIKYMTDGMLMREYLADNMLSRYSVIILDEAHERTIHTDVLFALLKKLTKKRAELKIIVTSATLNAEKFSRYFHECPIFTIPGRTFPVDILYTKEPESDYVDAALITTMQIHLSEPAGDILIFLTGQEEIETAAEILYNRMKGLGPNVPKLLILPAYGALPSEMQSRIFQPAPPGTRKCVVATNIAEASLTIDGVFYVIDPGFVKQNVYNAKLGMDTLVPVPISQASARQRAGRAGRTGPGKCYRLYTEIAYKEEMLPTSIPELQRTNLANVVLQLKAMGINDMLGFDFMDPPPAETLVAALEKLYALDALDAEGLLTRTGRKMAEFPLEPVLAKTLLTSVLLKCSEEVVTVVSMLSVESPFYRPKDKQGQADQKRARFIQNEGDHTTLLAVYQSWKKSSYSNSWCYDNFIQVRSIKRAHDIRKQLLGIMDRYRLRIQSCGRKYELIQKAVTSGFFMNAAKKDPQEGFKTLVEGQNVYVHPSSALFNRTPQYVLYHELVMTSKEYMRNIMKLDPKWLVQFAPNFYRKTDPTKISKRKRAEKIEPLFDRFNEKDAWRLSKRRG